MCFSEKEALKMELHVIKRKESKFILELFLDGKTKLGQTRQRQIQAVMEGLWMVRIG